MPAGPETQGNISRGASTQVAHTRTLKSIRTEMKKEKPKTTVYISLLSDDEEECSQNVYEIEDSDNASTRAPTQHRPSLSHPTTKRQQSSTVKKKRRPDARSATGEMNRAVRETSLNVANTSRARTPKAISRMSPIIIDDDISSDDEDIPSHIDRDTVTLGTTKRLLFPPPVGVRKPIVFLERAMSLQTKPKPLPSTLRPITVEIHQRPKGQEPIVTIEISDDESDQSNADEQPVVPQQCPRNRPQQEEPKREAKNKDKKCKKNKKYKKSVNREKVKPKSPQTTIESEVSTVERPKSCLKRSNPDSSERTPSAKRVKLEVKPEISKSSQTSVYSVPVYKDCAVQADLPPRAAVQHASAQTPPCSDLDVGDATTSIKREPPSEIPKQISMEIGPMEYGPTMTMAHDFSPSRQRPHWTPAEHLDLIREQSSLVRAQIGLCRQFHEYRAMEHEAFVFKCRRKVQQLAWGAMPTLFRSRKRRFEEICSEEK
ncbi:hypothetical protein VHEMI09300 [[Torrubiella] hemipterigena]|uniref:Uncharacterized protein n=1 Tax=[Torrubiella] hemipterigena TaxID=1531966 RepID=A0A0A1TG26_9HYPO|nr:hypothetical protein VHEMI09300 [[Torrubiella] hemipterigena]